MTPLGQLVVDTVPSLCMARGGQLPKGILLYLNPKLSVATGALQPG